MTPTHIREDLNKKLDGFKKRALQEHAKHNQAAAQIRDDDTLSDVGRRKRREELRTGTKRALDGIKAEQDAAIDELRKDLERRVYPTIGRSPQEVIAHRDAVDRARQLSDYQEAESAIRDAIRDGDTDLARAITRRAQAEGWHNATQAFATAYPAEAEAMNALAEIESLPGDLGFIMGQNMVYLPPSD